MSELSIVIKDGDVSINEMEARADVARFVAKFHPRDIVDLDSFKLADSDRLSLGRESKSYDEQRLVITRKLDTLKKDVMAKVSDIKKPITDMYDDIEKAQAEFIATEKQQRFKHLSEFYYDMAPILVDCIPPQDMIEDGWLSIKTDIDKAENALALKIQEIALGESTLDGLLEGSPLRQQVKAYYFTSQNLTETINHLNTLKKQMEAVDRLEREKAAINCDANIAESQQEPIVDAEPNNPTEIEPSLETAPQIALESFVLEFTCPLEIAQEAARLIRDSGYTVTKFRSVEC